jgi:hypothetical protein
MATVSYNIFCAKKNMVCNSGAASHLLLSGSNPRILSSDAAIKTSLMITVQKD